MQTSQLLIQLMLYVFLPLWGIAGFVDWCCHRATRIEHTSGLKESLIHSLMGIQMAVPILLCLLFKVNVLIMLICIAAWLAHEAVAHYDVHYAAPKRHISLWEMHAHNYLATLPLYMLLLIAVINYPVVVKLLTFDWQGEFYLQPMPYAHGGDTYLPYYLSFMAVVCVLPYMEENLRCLKAALKQRKVKA
ncbi:MAG: diguanylate cyclase [Gammaproteobacteria bacterium]|nr:diguanylate cyclase [Gammaproteobacteria bacterium]MBU1556361.1 diguanylate cyclase [Gammaproteobacteria bacterium]MBU2069430.1 diguanylate cyclase [Gammaproteobacteria bacterium]MBU2182935.1 diguanylate cyclase [Gammaproteobacteria bacterium]MBU2203283.1 diguanylate cyclase [Gammaproteobacteria bacterium]